MTGAEASLANALIAFCHTNLAHNQPDRFDNEVVKNAFQANPDMSLKMVKLFETRFKPEIKKRTALFEKALKEVREAIESYNTGHRYLDDVRKTIFRTCLLLITHTLKTNFFVAEKIALSFRLDPAYLDELGADFTGDLPPAKPFRITFFFSRLGIGYHIGFSDIARGGWRTIICRSEDEYLVNTNTLFREVFVLAHTQHLKNKDIYEGGSKMTVILSARDPLFPEPVAPRLYKLQSGLTNAFLDLFVTEKGKAKDPRVVDYYGEDEPIELGPDENMHDHMIEVIAHQAEKRGYLLGKGIMSSKKVGINHKEYGVTSRGVMAFAHIAMGELGLDIHKDPFTVRMTGGTNGDVAGNALLLLVNHCPEVRILSIAAGSGAIYDPRGIDLKELKKLILKKDIVDFDPRALHATGFILNRRKLKREGHKELHQKLMKKDAEVVETWVTVDEFHREFDSLIFSITTDLFLPCGGRPETIDDENWPYLFPKDNRPSVRVIVEGANSFITPKAREEIQKRGVILLRDASANKCGVISSSYEIIANLMMNESEFIANKRKYVRDVIHILEKRAAEEARLIFKRHREQEGKSLYTEISRDISTEINAHYEKLFCFLQGHPHLVNQALFKRMLLNHLPAILQKDAGFKGRLNRLPPKIKYAILAAEIATSIVYQGGWEPDFESQLRSFLKKRL
jgi:glutamate dehydrogenase